MKKLTGEFRLRRMLVIGIAIGLVAGVLCTGVAAKSFCQKIKRNLPQKKKKLKKKTNELKEEIMKHEAANNSAEALGSDKEGWALVLVNDSHPLDVSYVPESMVELESERFVDARIEEPLRQMLDDGAKAGLSMYVASAYRSSEKQKEVLMQPCRTGWQTDVRLWKLMMRRKSQWQFRERANMRPDLQWIL